MTYDLLLLQLRRESFAAGDNRSLVAIAAEFERNGLDRLRELICKTGDQAHIRNQYQPIKGLTVAV